MACKRNLAFWSKAAETNVLDIHPERKITLFLCSDVLILLTKQISGELHDVLRSPPFPFHKPPDDIFPPSKALASRCKSRLLNLPRNVFSLFVQDIWSAHSFPVFETSCRPLYHRDFRFFHFSRNFFQRVHLYKRRRKSVWNSGYIFEKFLAENRQAHVHF